MFDLLRLLFVAVESFVGEEVEVIRESWVNGVDTCVLPINIELSTVPQPMHAVILPESHI